MNSFEKNIRIRVAAILIREDQILLIQHQKEGKKYWLLPGGGVIFGEDLKTALKREIKEELGINVVVNDLIHSSDSIPKDHKRHIVNLYFSCDFLSGKYKLAEEERLVDYGFFSISDLQKMKIIPPIKKEIIQYIEDGKSKKNNYLGSRWDEI